MTSSVPMAVTRIGRRLLASGYFHVLDALDAVPKQRLESVERTWRRECRSYQQIARRTIKSLEEATKLAEEFRLKYENLAANQSAQVANEKVVKIDDLTLRAEQVQRIVDEWKSSGIIV